jgi:hypothetical protein
MKGVYQVAETNLFSQLPSSKSSFSKTKSISGQRGYTNPSNEVSNVRTSLEYSNRNFTNLQPNLYNNQPSQPPTRTNRTQNESSEKINHFEMEKLKENNFLEIKSIIFVFDEIVQNAMYLTDLKSNSI